MALKEVDPKSFIRIRGEEHNVKALMDLLSLHKIKINAISAIDSRPGALEKITDDFIPSMRTQIEVAASYEDTKKALESDTSFREHVKTILGSI